ncbi:minor capsid protein [Levyella massiliensis]|uniref:minor capsid protein n=1 Tax=Levyella massiliensis TaxID=938289 RepID=UPI0024ADC008|nr:minor capsid protein [Levyella massiliensis]
MKKLQTEDMAKAIDRGIRYTRKREQLHIDQLRAADAAFNSKLAALYRSTGRDITDEILSQYLRYCTGTALDIHQAYQKADKMDVFAFAERAKAYVESRDFSTKANEELKLYNLKMRTSRLELMKRQIELDGLKLYDKEDAMLRKRLQKEAMNEVERQAGILGLSETTRKSLVRGVAKVINGDFHGAPFSSRIWANKNELVARLQVGLERSILQGEHPDRWARLFTDLVSAEMGDKAGRALFAARRLAITESARVMSEIQLNSFEKGGFTKYIWITEMDDRTCPICSALDEEVFDIDRSEIGANLPPLHPFCRCSIAAFVDDPVRNVFAEEKERHYAKDVENQSSNSLKRGIISYNKRIAEHEDKINNPDKFYLDWNEVPDNVKNGRLKHWRKEIDNFKRSIEDNLWELRRRNDER